MTVRSVQFSWLSLFVYPCFGHTLAGSALMVPRLYNTLSHAMQWWIFRTHTYRFRVFVTMGCCGRKDEKVESTGGDGFGAKRITWLCPITLFLPHVRRVDFRNSHISQFKRFGGFCLLFNNITGPGMVVLQTSYQVCQRVHVFLFHTSFFSMLS